MEGGGNQGNLDVVGQEQIQEKIGRSLFCAGSEVGLAKAILEQMIQKWVNMIIIAMNEHF